MLRKAFGRRLRFLRLLVNKTQAALAEAVGVTEEHLGNIERGVSVPSFPLICRLAQELDTPPNNLFLFDGLDLSGEVGPSMDWDGMDWKQYITRVGYWDHVPQEGSIVLSNSLYEILGYEPSSRGVRAKRLMGMIHPDDLPSVTDSWRRFLKGQYPTSHTFRFFRRDGTLRMGLAQGEVEKDEYGKPVRFHGVFLDITEQKRFEASLLATRRKMEEQVAVRTRDMREALSRAEREAVVRARAEEELAQELERRLLAEGERERSEAQLELILTAMADGVVYYRSPDMAVTWCNRNYAVCLGTTTPAELVGKRCYELLHKRKKACDDCPVVRSFASGRTEETERRTPDGRFWSVRAFPVLGADGRVSGVVEMSREITDSKRAEEERAESEERYRGLTELMRRMADNMPDLLWAKDMNNRFLFTNQAICDKLLRCADTSEPLGRDDLYFARRERQAGHEHTFGEVCVDSDLVVKEAGKSGRFLEDGLVRGEYLALDVHKAPFFDADGNMIGTVGAGRDVTADEAVRKALEESEERFRLLAEHSPDIVWLNDSDFRMTYVSPACETILGYTPEELKTISREDMFAPESLAIVERVRGEYVTNKAAGRMVRVSTREDLIHKAKDGRLVRMEVVTAPVYDSQDRFRGVVGISRDVSEQRQAEAEVRESLEKYRILFELDFDAIFLVENDTTRILDANRAAEDLLGYSRQELTGLRLAELSTEPELTVQSSKTELENAERFFRRKNGEMVPVEVSSSHFIWQERRVHIAALRDVSDRKRLEQERRDVERMLRHELRTPAQAAVTMASVLKEEGALEGESLQMLNELERLGRCMLETMDLHADLQRLETGQFRPRPQAVDLAEVCASAGRDMAYLAEARSVNMAFDCPSPGTCVVQGDERLLHSAVVNLIKNALEACAPGDLVRLCCRRENGRWLVGVRNPGVVPQAFRKHMFEKYATRGKLGGQGLGCYLARRVAEAHGGETWVDCGDGRSTEVVLALPARTGH